jgi:hypothetical protein
MHSPPVSRAVMLSNIRAFILTFLLILTAKIAFSFQKWYFLEKESIRRGNTEVEMVKSGRKKRVFSKKSENLMQSLLF